MRINTIIERAAIVWACDCTEINVPCTCGKQPRIKAIEAIKARPGKSDRAIAKEIGVSHQTVGRVRAESTGPDGPVERTGLDGKTRKLPARQALLTEDMPTEEEANESWQNDLYDQACLLLDRMAGPTRQRLFAHIRRTYHDEN